jgi:hypothetical protein
MLTPLSELMSGHGLNPLSTRMYDRFYGLRSVYQTPTSHSNMLTSVLSHLSECCSFSRDNGGLLVYAKTQSHNTFFESDWLKQLASSQGMRHWEWLTVSMNHCASALSVIHCLNSMAEQRLVVLLTGEKSFHPWISRLSVAVLGELPVASLLNSGSGKWRVTDTAVGHKPRFFMNPKDMSDLDRAALQRSFSEDLQSFIKQTLHRCGLRSDEIDLIVPYNLNLPLLRMIANHFGWQNKLYIANIPSVGHSYCSDVLYNFAQVLPSTDAKRVMAFAAGLGVTFSSLLLERI